MKQAIADYLNYLRARQLDGTLNPPATESELSAFEADYHIQLPESFRLVYQTFNGQKNNDEEARFLSLAEIPTIQKKWQNFIVQHYGLNHQNNALFHDPAIRGELFNPLWLPFMVDADGSLYCLDYAPTEKGLGGQIIFIGLETEIKHFDLLLEAVDFESWFKSLCEANFNRFEPYYPALCADYFQHQIEMNAPLNPPVNLFSIHQIEKRFNLQLPECYLALLQLFNGYNSHLPNRWLALEDILDVQNDWKSALQQRTGKNHSHERVQNTPFHPLWLPIYLGDNQLLCLDFAPAPDGHWGQIISIHLNEDGYSIDWEAENLAQYLEQLLAENG